MSGLVICLGEVLFDCLADQSGVPVDQVQSWTAYPGGAPANVATALTKLGTSSAFVGCVGQDKPGESLTELLQTIGVDVSGIQHHSTAPTRQVLVTRSLTGDRTFAGFKDYATTEFADTYLQASQLPIALFDAADFLVVGTLGLAYADSRAAILKALDLANHHHLKILVDVNWRPVFWLDPEEAPNIILPMLEQADFLKLSLEEAEWLFQTSDPDIIRHRQGNWEGILVTDGDRGCRYSLSGHSGTVPAFPVQVVDTTGAGDSFVAGFLHQLCQHKLACLQDAKSAYQVVRYASAVGASTATKAGAIAAQPSAAEVDTLLAMTP